jgi:hypothetical protein
VKEIIAAAAAGPGHRLPLPHPRCGHWRALRANRFREQGRARVRPADINNGLQVRVKKSVYEVIS